MHDITIAEARLIVGGQWARRPDETNPAESGWLAALTFGAVCTDTRQLVQGDLFLALRGQRFDGSAFLPQAEAAGARVMVAERLPDGYVPGVPVILVDDALEALGRLARHHRDRQKACVVGITGSNGKTTTRELACAVLRSQFEVLQNQANENNRIGVPKTLLRLNSHHDFAVIEMGTSEKGEIAALARIAAPQCGVLTAVGESHLLGLGDLDGVMREKGDLLAALGRDGIAIVNFDDARCVRAAERANCRVVGYGTDARCELRATDLRANRHGTHFTLNGRHEFRLPLHGLHNVSNALAAIAVGWVSGIDIPVMQLALRRAEPVGRRLEYAELAGIGLLDDSYNANPASTRAALRTLAAFETKGQRIAVLGDMLELGEHSARLHREVGAYAASQGIDLLITAGRETRALADAAEEGFAALGRGAVWRCNDSAEAARMLLDEARAGDLVLVKGSHGMRMDAVSDALKARYGAPTPALVTRPTLREQPVGDPLPARLHTTKPIVA
ncbi:MAG: UDP-N-acetylmuramoyl-tripeptide--D-alanyl-D-alanine ligase [Planctomycetes bacterium]|jgi:UDP-N-acetylmuramoyl-tripeptide--D-alanyl-D-alanine ligase|nr:UDP-N-acetylmuramoyl-tripeptide--D-alanyl-D-alanine ligase [Planctomycetota bacterium]MCL4729817.1 UDP-N-acetylmuramoyl-tripeptide--D-alanyl-D-alanine ligase [Planctomycetota bacterium]